jgi:leucyl-tRNA synthetase
MKPYDHKKIEKKWQKVWEKSGIYEAKDFSRKKKFYTLIEFPYPSGDGLHVGHILSNTAMDIISRKRRMEGYNVLYPIGWDAFGLPTENYAIKTGTQPKVVTKKNTDTFRRQLKSLGFSFDWSREINTTDPAYYKWTQWIFLKFLENGLAYKKKMNINWCPKDRIGLANEEVIDGKCERCGSSVEKREKEQWILAITKYADRLDKDLDEVDYLERIKTQQKNWIGKSEGAHIKFRVQDTRFPSAISLRSHYSVQESLVKRGKSEELEVFTTRPDTLFGVTYVVIAPEHPLIKRIEASGFTLPEEVKKYIDEVKGKSEIQRSSSEKEKTGVELKGWMAVNPVNNEYVPIWIADYVLLDYGTGAVMAVPAHDERDFAFAKKYKLPIKHVIQAVFGEKRPGEEVRKTISAIVQRKSDKKFLLVKWNEFKWIAPVIGGIEEGEILERAAEREVFEETGYRARAVRKLGGIIESHFFAENKNVWRGRFNQPILLELISEKQEQVSEEEKKKHQTIWLSGEEALKQITHSDNKVGFQLFLEDSEVFKDHGVLINSEKFNGMNSKDAQKAIVEHAKGKMVTTYKLRDWVFSRQRYWGEPIPVIHCAKCGIVPVPEKDLPVKLPEVKNYQPTNSGESPLASISTWVNIKCPSCKGPAKRETDTMPNWAGSSWYYLRYADPKNKAKFSDAKNLKYWTPVDWYNGGMEHTTLHLLYSRFWHKFLYDIKLVPTKEPYKKRTSHGLILAHGGVKMSKSKGNVINPDKIVSDLGADSLRMYEMFMGPFDQHVAWNTDGIVGVRRFLEKVWNLQEKISQKRLSKGITNDATKIEGLVHRTIKKVTDDIEAMRFNTAVSSMMILMNEFDKQESVLKSHYETLLLLLAPFAPHITEELWQVLGHRKSIHGEKWSQYDQSKLKYQKKVLAVQINGKVRAEISIEEGEDYKNLEKRAFGLDSVKKWIDGKTIKKVIVVKEKLISIVTN